LGELGVQISEKEGAGEPTARPQCTL